MSPSRAFKNAWRPGVLTENSTMQLNKPSAFSVEALMSRECGEFDNRRCRSIRHCVSTASVQHVNSSHLNTSKSATDINDPQSYAQAMLPSTSRTNNDQCEATRERNTGIRLRSLALREKTWENGNTIQSRSLFFFFPLVTVQYALWCFLSCFSFVGIA